MTMIVLGGRMGVTGRLGRDEPALLALLDVDGDDLEVAYL